MIDGERYTAGLRVGVFLALGMVLAFIIGWCVSDAFNVAATRVSWPW